MKQVASLPSVQLLPVVLIPLSIILQKKGDQNSLFCVYLIPQEEIVGTNAPPLAHLVENVVTQDYFYCYQMGITELRHT